MNVPVVASPLVSLMFLHQGNELFGGPSLCLKVVVITGASSGVHLEE